jgi:hypothetical protein
MSPRDLLDRELALRRVRPCFIDDTDGETYVNEYVVAYLGFRDKVQAALARDAAKQDAARTNAVGFRDVSDFTWYRKAHTVPP